MCTILKKKKERKKENRNSEGKKKKKNIRSSSIDFLCFSFINVEFLYYFILLLYMSIYVLCDFVSSDAIARLRTPTFGRSEFVGSIFIYFIICDLFYCIVFIYYLFFDLFMFICVTFFFFF
eukprot:Rmarinus@m.24367